VSVNARRENFIVEIIWWNPRVPCKSMGNNGLDMALNKGLGETVCLLFTFVSPLVDLKLWSFLVVFICFPLFIVEAADMMSSILPNECPLFRTCLAKFKLPE
jgi:hypothetical protein